MRPTDLTPEMAASLVKLVEDGMPLSKAAAHEGVHWSTFCRWRKRKGQPYEAFRDSLKRAQAVAQKQMIADIRDGVNNWQARAWYLERSDPKNWGRKDKVETTTAPKPEDKRKTKEELWQRIEELRAMANGKDDEVH